MMADPAQRHNQLPRQRSALHEAALTIYRTVNSWFGSTQNGDEPGQMVYKITVSSDNLSKLELKEFLEEIFTKKKERNLLRIELVCIYSPLHNALLSD